MIAKTETSTLTQSNWIPGRSRSAHGALAHHLGIGRPVWRNTRHRQDEHQAGPGYSLP